MSKCIYVQSLNLNLEKYTWFFCLFVYFFGIGSQVAKASLKFWLLMRALKYWSTCLPFPCVGLQAWTTIPRWCIYYILDVWTCIWWHMPIILVFSVSEGTLKLPNQTTAWVERKVYWGSNYQGYLWGSGEGREKQEIGKASKFSMTVVRVGPLSWYRLSSSPWELDALPDVVDYGRSREVKSHLMRFLRNVEFRYLFTQ